MWGRDVKMWGRYVECEATVWTPLLDATTRKSRKFYHRHFGSFVPTPSNHWSLESQQTLIGLEKCSSHELLIYKETFTLALRNDQSSSGEKWFLHFFVSLSLSCSKIINSHVLFTHFPRFRVLFKSRSLVTFLFVRPSFERVEQDSRTFPSHLVLSLSLLLSMKVSLLMKRRQSS